MNSPYWYFHSCLILCSLIKKHLLSVLANLKQQEEMILLLCTELTSCSAGQRPLLLDGWGSNSPSEWNNPQARTYLLPLTFCVWLINYVLLKLHIHPWRTINYSYSFSHTLFFLLVFSLTVITLSYQKWIYCFAKWKLKRKWHWNTKQCLLFFKERNAKEKRKIKPNLLAEFIQEITSYFNEDPFLKNEIT